MNSSNPNRFTSSTPGGTVPQIAVVGVGAIGSGVVQCFAAAGYAVVQLTRDGSDRMSARLQTQVDRGRLTMAEAVELMSRISATTIEDVPPVALVVEAVAEDEAVKVDVLCRLAARLPERTVLASSTSTIPIATLARDVPNPERVIGMHFMTPVPRMQLVEVIRSAATSDDSAQRVDQWCRDIGKTAVTVMDHPGFVASRLAQALVHEAVHILSEGVATPEAIDAVATLGLNMPVGPLRLLDEVGIDVTLKGLDSLHTLLGQERYRPDPLLRELVASGSHGRKTGRGVYEYTEVA